MIVLGALVSLGTFLAVFTSSAEAQPARDCAPRERVVARLAETYGETRQSIGLESNRAVVETFANLKSGSWTITVTIANGTTCLVASGFEFESLDEQGQALGDDT
ncbi:MAG: hypothetical protein CSA70_03585 [Rhodobacterales bacterium]|nr:MAG: hypothetical protein CSA70_03585 [Rhodobacterales bacterium]